MLADTDAGCLITAAQSGAQWGYALLIPEIVLIPALYMVQEITVRLGVITKKGHGALIREHFGPKWAGLSAASLLASAIGALLTEFVGVAGVGELFGISKWVTVPTATAFLIGLALTRSYRKVERVGIAIGLAEFAFVPAMFLAHPHLHQVVSALSYLPVNHHSYLTLLAANVGAVIMPWMIFYQQGAVIDKGLLPQDLKKERHDTAVGAVITQLIMISVIVALAATAYQVHRGANLTTVAQIAHALSHQLGGHLANVLVGAAILGGAMVAALVVSVAGSWGIAEVLGWQHSLNERVDRRTAKFYITYISCHIVGAALVLTSFNLINLSIDVEVMNAMLLPIVLTLLLLLEARALPEQYRMKGAYRAIVRGVCIVIMAFSLFMIAITI
jgi:Mn2+/Fe2+ NRAMP family transporter